MSQVSLISLISVVTILEFESSKLISNLHVVILIYILFHLPIVSYFTNK